MDWSSEEMQENGISKSGGGAMAPISAIIRYTAGVVKRERERIAKLARENGLPESFAAALTDESEDAAVFKWAPPAGAGPTHRGQSET